MNKDEAILAAKALLGPAASSYVTDSFDWDLLLPDAVVPDENGIRPGEPGYVPTYDAYWLAGCAASLFATWGKASGTTTQLSVDGDSITKTAADWSTVSLDFFKKSPIWALVSDPSIIWSDGSMRRYRPTSYGVLRYG